MVRNTQLHTWCINPLFKCALLVHITEMTLLDFIRSSDFSFATFAEAIGETENIVRKWAYRQRQPSLPRAVKIERLTDGQVMARDLLVQPTEAD
jgi:hypothetical protein